jgi:uncharacterized membrane protein
MTRPRLERLDALRGLAIVWMALFHFAFDLNHFGLLEPAQNFYRDPFWTVQRAVIVTLFMAVAGLSLAAALDAAQPWPRFWRRWAQIAGCAVLVSARAAAPLRGWLWPLGALCLVLPWWVQHPWFDTRWTNWIGLVTRKPVTEDYAPVLPWLGVMLWGLAAGQWLLARRRVVLGGTLPRALAPLAALGRWPLTFYMLHQPVLIGAIMAWRALLGAAA